MGRDRLSEEGRLRCSAAGTRSVGALIEARRAAGPTLRAACEAFEADLLAELGPSPSPSRRALALAATASFSALFTVSQRLRAAYRFEKLVALSEQAVALSGALQRSLRGLNLAAGGPEPDGDAPSIADLQQEYAERKQGDPQ